MKNFIKHSDAELIEITAKEKEPMKSAAFSELYNRYSNTIYLYCRKVFGSDSNADDIFQDVFLHFLKCIENDVIISNVKGYLLRSARNISLNFKRDNKAVFVEMDDYHAQIIDNSLETKELSQLIDSAIELLTPEQREAFVLQTYNDLSYSEIAAITEVPISTVRNRVVRAKARLREILSPILNEKEQD